MLSLFTFSLLFKVNYDTAVPFTGTKLPSFYGGKGISRA